MNDILIENTSQILTMAGAGWVPLTGQKLKKLKIKENHSILIRDKRIAGILSEQATEKYKKENNPKIIDAKGNVSMPGLIDPHTHLVYGGTREEEFYMKLKGKSYLEILSSGNGIYRTVDATRILPEDIIFSESLRRVYDSVFYGTTTLEIKSGYGLDIDTEVKILSVIKRLSSLGLVNVVPTFLGLHAIPKGSTESSYVDYVINTVMPKVTGSYEFIDVFCDKGAFSVESTRQMARYAKSNGIRLKIHADELDNIGCLELCDEFQFTSVDHLLKTDESGMDKVKKSNAIAVFLPITAFSLGESKFPDISKFLNKEIPIALGTDASPVSYNSNLFFAIYLAVRYSNISIEEALNAATINAAFACGVESERGSIELGKYADIIILTVDDYKKIPYEYGARMVDSVITNGEVVMKSGVFQL